MGLTITDEGVGVEATEEHVAERVERLKRMFPSEPEVSVLFGTNGGGRGS